MPIDSFKFISPGVFVNEIDNSESPKTAVEQVGPLVVGRSKRGPANVPVQVRDYEQFVTIFGEPIPGGGTIPDAWRDINVSSPTYASYAAEAWLKNNRPITFIRLLGDEHDDRQLVGRAGWDTDNTVNTDRALNGGAFGLFVIDSGSASSHLTGALAAIFYVTTGSIALSGTIRNTDADGSGAGVLVSSVGDSKEFKAIIRNASNETVREASFNFTPSSNKYIRKVFNTNPTLTNNVINSGENVQNYWLGESFERHLDNLVTSSVAGEQWGIILPLAGELGEGSDFRYPNRDGKTGWFFSQDLDDNYSAYDPRNMQSLFRFHSLYGGDWASRNIKISITDIKPPTSTANPYGSFTVLVRSASDTDEKPVILEQYNRCNLNPSSQDFLGLKIGDKTLVWNDLQNKYDEVGIFDNRSKYIRVELNETILDGTQNPALLPFGCYGPVRHKGFALADGSTTALAFGSDSTAFTGSFVGGVSTLPEGVLDGTNFANVGADFTGSFEFPKLSLRQNSTSGGILDYKKTFYGINTVVNEGSMQADKGYSDYMKSLSAGYESLDEGVYTEYSWIFTLDDISGSATQDTQYAGGSYVEDSRQSGTSLSTVYGWKDMLNSGHNRFTVPLHGGFDGFDITEMEPLRNSLIVDGATDVNSSVYYTYKKAILAASDPEVVQMNLMTIPGLTNVSLTNMVANICEQRGDAMAIIDPEGGYEARAEGNLSYYDRIGSTTDVVNAIQNRVLETSYAAMYDPWIIAKDSYTGQRVVLPPSIAALGAMSNTDNTAGPWFAPAGFTRGGLSKGDAGITVVGVTRKLLADDRDTLYENRINPIANMPDVGITIWGQKTLLPSETSALNRVNVRRMMIYIKKAISAVAASTLFDPNVKTTWLRFKSSAEPILDDVKTRFGINNYKLILDESTTTPDLIDRNIVYAKIIVQPTRAIEFFAIDFVLTNSGASFED